MGLRNPNYKFHNSFPKSQNVNYKPYNSLIIQASIQCPTMCPTVLRTVTCLDPRTVCVPWSHGARTVVVLNTDHSGHRWCQS